MGRVPGVLQRAGIGSIGELVQWLPRELLSIPGIGPVSLARLQRRLELVGRLDQGSTRLSRTDGRNGVPKVPSPLFERVLDATSVRQEIEALAGGLSQRDAHLLRARMGARGLPPPSLEELAGRAGISRERARQVVAQHMAMLKGSGMRLPLASRLTEIVEREGGLLSTPELIRLARAQRISVTAGTLHVLPVLAELDLVPAVAHVAEVDSWATPAGARRWVRSGILAEQLARVRRVGGASIRRISCVDEARLADSSLLSPPQRFHALVNGRGEVSEIEGYVVPTPTLPSRLTRSVRKMLAVAPTLSIADVREGLAKARRELQDVPPISVLAHILAHHPGFQVRAGCVCLLDAAAPNGALSSAEEAFISVVDAEGGAIEYRKLLEGMEAAGFSRNTASVLASKSPLLQRVAPGVYGIRGRAITRGRILDTYTNTRSRTTPELQRSRSA